MGSHGVKNGTPQEARRKHGGKGSKGEGGRKERQYEYWCQVRRCQVQPPGCPKEHQEIGALLADAGK